MRSTLAQRENGWPRCRVTWNSERNLRPHLGQYGIAHRTSSSRAWDLDKIQRNHVPVSSEMLPSPPSTLNSSLSSPVVPPSEPSTPSHHVHSPTRYSSLPRSPTSSTCANCNSSPIFEPSSPPVPSSFSPEPLYHGLNGFQSPSPRGSVPNTPNSVPSFGNSQNRWPSFSLPPSPLRSASPASVCSVSSESVHSASSDTTGSLLSRNSSTLQLEGTIDQDLEDLHNLANVLTVCPELATLTSATLTPCSQLCVLSTEKMPSTYWMLQWRSRRRWN